VTSFPNPPRRTPLAPQRNTGAVAVLLAVALLGCAHMTPGTARRAPQSPTCPPAAVNPAQLDPGSYPTTAGPPLGDAGSSQVGRLVEATRMAGFVVGPWQADPNVSAAGANAAAVIDDFHQFARVLWPPIAGGAYGLPFLVGFSAERQSTGPDPKTLLRNAVLRFADPTTASTAAAGLHDRAMHMPKDPRATPIVTGPEQAIPIPGHPEAAAALLTFQEGAQSVRELSVFTAHGPYVLVQVARCPAGPDCETPLAAHTLDLQLPLIDKFAPTAADQFAALPRDPTGLVARNLPLPADQATPTTGAAYDPAGALQFESDPVHTGPALTAAGVDEVAINLTTVYQAADPARAQTLAEAYSDTAAKTEGAQPAPPVPGLPQSRCTRVPEAGGLIPRYWCLAAAGRYTIKAVARQVDNAHQQIAAQYRILTR